MVKLIGKVMYHLGIGYTVQCAEYDAVHWSPDWADAVEWAECYPSNAEVKIFSGSVLVGMRTRLS